MNPRKITAPNQAQKSNVINPKNKRDSFIVNPLLKPFKDPNPKISPSCLRPLWGIPTWNGWTMNG